MLKFKNKTYFNRPYFLAFILILSLLIYLAQFLPYKFGINETDSLPQKIFLIKKGALPQRGDYAVFNKPNKWYKKDFVKKIIGVSGDEIKELNNHISILINENHQIIDAGFAKEFSLHGEKLTHIQAGIILADYYFAHAPHKDSLDSRYTDIGLISKTEIIGVATPIDGYCLLILLIIFCFFLLRFLQKKQAILTTILLFLFFNVFIFSHAQSFAKDFGVNGTIYPIKEPDLALVFKNKLSQLEKSGKLAKIQKQWQDKTIAGTKRPKPVEGLHKATQTREFIYDPSVTVKQDIRDHQGNLIAAKGKRINPFNFRNLPQHLLFIDADDKNQLAWAKKKAKAHSSMIILTNGGIVDLMKSEKIRLYFDQGGFLVKTFGIQAVPAIVYQEGKVMKIREEVV